MVNSNFFNAFKDQEKGQHFKKIVLDVHLVTHVKHQPKMKVIIFLHNRICLLTKKSLTP